MANNWDIPSDADENSSAHKFYEYQTWFEEYSRKKINEGNLKNLQFSAINKFISVSGKVPWQVFKYSDRQVSTFKRAFDDFIANPNPDVPIVYEKASPFCWD